MANGNRVPTGTQPLGALEDYEVADGEPDIRGWRVRGAEGTDLGRVDELLVDTDALRVRFLEVSGKDGSQLIPVDEVQLDRDSKHVLLGGAAIGRPSSRAGRDAGGARVERMEEELAVGKRSVQAGELAIRKRVSTGHVRKQVPLSHDEVTVERRPVHEVRASAADMRDQDIRVPLRAEEAVVEKRPVVKEEIREPRDDRGR